MRVFTENRYISVKQEMEFLDLVNPVQIQAIAWLRKWVLIVPLWNWNTLAVKSLRMDKSSSNRTFMELK